MNTKGAIAAATVVAIASIAYGLIPAAHDNDPRAQFDNEYCGSVLFPGNAAGETVCAGRMPTGLLWVIIVASVATAIYFAVKGNDEKN